MTASEIGQMLAEQTGIDWHTAYDDDGPKIVITYLRNPAPEPIESALLVDNRKYCYLLAMRMGSFGMEIVLNSHVSNSVFREFRDFTTLSIVETFGGSEKPDTRTYDVELLVVVNRHAELPRPDFSKAERVSSVSGDQPPSQ